MTQALKTEYDMREVAAHKFWQDARPGDLFAFPRFDPTGNMGRVYEFVGWEASFEDKRGFTYLPTLAERTDPWDGRTYAYCFDIPIDDRIIWYKQVPWKGMED